MLASVERSTYAEIYELFRTKATGIYELESTEGEIGRFALVVSSTPGRHGDLVRFAATPNRALAALAEIPLRPHELCGLYDLDRFGPGHMSDAFCDAGVQIMLSAAPGRERLAREAVRLQRIRSLNVHGRAAADWRYVVLSAPRHVPQLGFGAKDLDDLSARVTRAFTRSPAVLGEALDIGRASQVVALGVRIVSDAKMDDVRQRYQLWR